MNVLVCGARGFIGREVVRHLQLQGHSVVAAGRRSHDPQMPRVMSCAMDFGRMLTAEDWLPCLSGVDAVINAVGVLRDRPSAPMREIHTQAPIALFGACAQLGIRRVLQISALGIESSRTLYASSKRAADDHLIALCQQGQLDGTVLQPSIVFGPGGASSQLFLALAKFPALLLPSVALKSKVQPVALSDLAEACARLIRQQSPMRLAAVGPRALTLSDFIACLRQQLGQRPALTEPLPERLTQWSAKLGNHLSFQPWGTETLTLLKSDNCADAGAFEAVLGRRALAPENFLRNQQP